MSIVTLDVCHNGFLRANVKLCDFHSEEDAHAIAQLALGAAEQHLFRSSGDVELEEVQRVADEAIEQARGDWRILSGSWGKLRWLGAGEIDA